MPHSLIHFTEDPKNESVRVVCGKIIVQRHRTLVRAEVTCPDCRGVMTRYPVRKHSHSPVPLKLSGNMVTLDIERREEDDSN